MTPFTVRAELAASIRRVNLVFARIPEAERPEVGWSATDDLLEIALRGEDRQQALQAVREWERHWIELFRAVTR